MPAFLTASSQLMCPHGGTVTISSSDTRVQAIDGAVLTSSDVFVVGGCPFVLPPAIAHPCMTLQWAVTCVDSAAMSVSCLSESSTAMCQAADQAVQGTAEVVNTQPQAEGQ